MSLKKIIRTANDGRDHPCESFVNLPAMREDKAQAIADAINDALSGEDPAFFPDYFTVVPESYQPDKPFKL